MAASHITVLFLIFAVWQISKISSQSTYSSDDTKRDMYRVLNEVEQMKTELKQATATIEELTQATAKIEETVNKVEQLKTELKQATAKIEELSSDVTQLKELKSTTGQQGVSANPSVGSVYVRYGRSSCPNTNNTEMIYTGFIGGSHYTHVGGGIKYLCLPKYPEWLKTKAGAQGASYIYGGEYKITAGLGDLFDHTYSQSHHQQDPLCAVCHARSRHAKVMIPGRVTCPGQGWTREYYGYLMTAHHTHNGRTEQVCVDHDPEGRIGGSEYKKGAFFYFIEAVCGSLPCPPYVKGNEITCVVCTK